MSDCQAFYLLLLHSYIRCLPRSHRRPAGSAFNRRGKTELPVRAREARRIRAICDDFGMRSRIEAVVLPPEPNEFREEVRRIFQELERTPGEEVLAGECAPALDVFETEERVEIAVDLPGVSPASVRIVARGQSLLIVGNKAPRRQRP